MKRRSFTHALLAALGWQPQPARPEQVGTSPPETLRPTRVAPPHGSLSAGTNSVVTDIPPPWLEEWRRRPIQPVMDHSEMTGRSAAETHNWTRLHDALQGQAPVTLHYHGGSEPGRLRTLIPALIFHKIHDDEEFPPLYTLAWCQLRGEHRTFRLDRISWPEADRF